MVNLNDNRIFEPGRFGLLLRLQIVTGVKILTIIVGVIMGSLILVSLFMGRVGALSSAFEEVYRNSFGNILFLGGIIFTSKAFEHFYKKEININTLMLPASQFEKGFVWFLLTAIGWPLLVILMFVVLSLLSSGLNLLLWRFASPVFLPSQEVFRTILQFIIVHSIFFLGAAVFRKGALFKTLLTIVILLSIFGILAGLLTLAFFSPELRDYAHISGTLIQIDNANINITQGFAHWEYIGKVLGYFIIPVFCWITAFIRLREIEVKDGV